ncbi:uncharacterized protein [Scyliorhinus torazame]|uniref:uncharacterized protein n=1 Tax=Scyliorhinus torazame TaxID=75743 RepID=UPI003B5B83A1
MALATKNPGQTQYCPFVSKDQEETAQWLENNSIMSVNSDDITVRTMDASQSKACILTDSLHKSQAQVVLKSRNGDPEEMTNDTPWIFPRTPEQVEPGEKEFEMNSNLPHENIQSKSPRFCFLNMSTPKSTEFNLFGRTAFDLTNTPEQYCYEVRFGSQRINLQKSANDPEINSQETGKHWQYLWTEKQPLNATLTIPNGLERGVSRPPTWRDRSPYLKALGARNEPQRASRHYWLSRHLIQQAHASAPFR